MNALVKLEPIPLPPARRPTQMPSLPGWLASQKNALAVNLQVDPVTGRYEDMMTLPAELMPSDAQRQAIESHCLSLSLLLDQTPQHSEDYEKATLVIVTKLLLAKASQKNSELSAEAKGDAYMAALDDVPSWAVEAAVRRWYRGECGEDEKGRPYDYTWAPDSAVLRKLAHVEVWRVKSHIKELQPILYAQPFRDCSAELEAGRAAWDGLWKTMPLGAEALKALTFERAVELGREAPPAPAQEQPAA